MHARAGPPDGSPTADRRATRAPRGSSPVPGSGRGGRVTGVDFNRASIEYARQDVRGRLRYLEADYTRDLPSGPFDLAILIYLDFGTHLPDVQRALLRDVCRRLRPGGRLVLDYLDAKATDRHRPCRGWEARGRCGGGLRSE